MSPGERGGISPPLNRECEEADGGPAPSGEAALSLRNVQDVRFRAAREGDGMLSRALLNRIVRDEALVRGLGDAEARVLVEWLVEQAEQHADDQDDTSAAAFIQALCRRGRAIGRFVYLWCHQGSQGAATQLAAVERFAWPLPTDLIDPYILMQEVLAWEGDQEDDRVSA